MLCVLPAESFSDSVSQQEEHQGVTVLVPQALLENTPAQMKTVPWFGLVWFGLAFRRIFLCIPDLKFRDPLACASWVLGLKACATSTWLRLHLFCYPNLNPFEISLTLFLKAFLCSPYGSLSSFTTYTCPHKSPPYTCICTCTCTHAYKHVHTHKLGTRICTWENMISCNFSFLYLETVSLCSPNWGRMNCVVALNLWQYSSSSHRSVISTVWATMDQFFTSIHPLMSTRLVPFSCCSE